MHFAILIAALLIALPAHAFDFGCRFSGGCQLCWEGAQRSKICKNGEFRHWSVARPAHHHGRGR